MRATMEVRATLVGYIWMPNVPAWKNVCEKLSRQDRPFTLHVERGTSTRERRARGEHLIWPIGADERVYLRVVED